MFPACSINFKKPLSYLQSVISIEETQCVTQISRGENYVP
nr:MAG TPA: hypothetical protein [Caudoviricetes sp.]